MNTPNPAQVASARTARLVREAQTPVYSTSTPVQQHMMAVEVDSGIGRYWREMPENKVNEFCDNLAPSYSVSDIDHSAKCWCFYN